MLAVLAGLVLLILPDRADSGQTEVTTVRSAAEYCLSLEQKTKTLIMELEGVSSCSVAITLGYGYEYIYASDQKVKEDFYENGSVSSKEVEKKYITVTSQNTGAPVLLREKMPTVLGIAVVCKGASLETQVKILSVLGALYDIAPEKISVQT